MAVGGVRVGFPLVRRVVTLLDGSVVPIDRPILRADDLGVLRGDGVFEALLVSGGETRDLAEHLQRLATSAATLELAIPDAAAWRRGVDAAIGAWASDDDLVLRLIATRGPDGGGPPTCFVIGGEVPDGPRRQRDGVRVRVLGRGMSGDRFAALAHLLPSAKSLSYAVNMAMVRAAKAAGDDDVVLVDPDGFVLEGPTSTVVVAHGRTLTTPPPPGILDGVTVRRLFAAAGDAGWRTDIGALHVDELTGADGAWLVSSIRQMAPIVAIDGVARPAGIAHAELAALLAAPRPA